MHNKLDSKVAKEKDLLFQIRPLDDRLQVISQQLWDPGEHFAIDEWVCGYQGKDQYATKINFKTEGDGYLADVLAMGKKGVPGGYAYAWRFRHSCNEGRNKDFSALHNRFRPAP